MDLYFTNLRSIVVEQNVLTDRNEYNKWLVVPYETADFQGEALVAMDNFYPPKIELSLAVEGWYKIYLGLLSFGGRAGIGIQFGNGGKTIVEPKSRVPRWQSHEWIEEGFFRAMDLTGKNLNLTKFDCPGLVTTGGLAYIRLVPMTEEEVNAYQAKEGGCVAFHYDIDFSRDDDYENVEEMAGRLEMLENAHGGEWFLETSFDDCETEEPKNYTYLSVLSETYAKRYGNYVKNHKKYEEFLINKARDMGYKTYATNRMELADFCFPYSLYSWESGIAEQYPEYRCKMRDERNVEILSYAFPQVRKLMIDVLMKSLAQGFDGLTLIFHRGLHVAFEQPVIEKVQQLYGVDARTLPFSDKRLYGVLCDIMTTFMRELKAEVVNVYGQEKKINVIVYYNATASKYFGLDVDAWCKEGLVDGVCQGLMTHYEDLTNCLGDNGLIDIKKYKIANGKRPVLCRYYGGNKSMIVDGAKELKAICDCYGKTFYATLLWEGEPVTDIWDLVEQLKENGVQKYISWNANHKAKDLQYLNAERAISRGATQCGEEHRFIRVLSIAGKDISSFCQNWRG